MACTLMFPATAAEISAVRYSRSRERVRGGAKRYPLRGQPIRYVGPFESVDEDNWEALR